MPRAFALMSALVVPMFLFTAPGLPEARAQLLYWDANDVTTGAGATPTGIWGTDLFWSLDPNGEAATAAWTAGATAIFSAGADASGAFTVTVSGTQAAGNMIIEEGTVTLAGGAVAVGAGNVTVNAGATLSTDSSLRLTSTAGATMTINGGTVRTTNPGAAGTFIDTDFAITLGAAGGTFSHVTTNILNIVQTATTVVGPGSLTKEGIGVLAIAGALTYEGSTIINDGELRIRGAANRLPVTTAVIVNSPGILNLNSVAPSGVGQHIGSLAGNGTVGLGSCTLVVGDSTSTEFSGSIRNIANYGAGGVSSGAGRVSKRGSGSLTFTGINTFTGSLTNNEGEINVSPGAILCDPAADIVVNGGSLNLSNAAQTVLSLSGTGGVVHLAPGHTLTVNPSSTRTYYGSVTGSGVLIKTGTGTLGLAGNSSYDSTTFVNAGKLSVGFATALGATSSGTEVASGAELLFDGATNIFTINEPLKVVGPGAGDGGAITVQNSAKITISSPVTLAGDTTNTVSGTGTVSYNHPTAITALGDYNLTLQGGGLSTGNGGTISGVISLGAGSLTKQQGGRWTLSAANDYSGGTFINAGTIRIANTTGSALGSGPVTVATGGSLGGPGSFTGELTLNGAISPGTSPGTMNTGNEIWNGGASYAWEVNDATGAAGTDPGWDLVNITGTLTINATPASKFTINVVTLTPGNVAGAAANFDDTQDYTWTIATASGGITGFDPAAFNIVTNSFTNALGTGAFTIEQSGNDLRLRFGHPPAIAMHPVDASAECGTGSASFTVMATGVAPLSYQWRHAGTNLAGATASTLNLNNISSAQAGAYDCVVSNPFGSTTSLVATLIVTDTVAPVITNCAPNQIIAANGSCQGVIPNLTLQIVAGDDCGPLLITQDPAAGTLVPLGPTNVTLIVMDGASLSATCTVVVTVTDQSAPTITSCAPDQTACTNAGGQVALPDFTAQVVATDNCGGFTAMQNPPAGTLVTAGDSTNVIITLTDTAANATNCSVTFTVNAFTTVSALAAVNNACPGANVTFGPVTAGGTGPFNYAWTSNGVTLAGENGTSLTLSSIEASAAGTYCVIATGACGSATNCAALTVAAPPTFTVQPQNQATPMGNGVVFTSTATSPVAVTYQWQSNGVEVAGATASSLAVSNLSLANHGDTFQVVATTCGGSTTSLVATLTVTPIAGISFDFDTPLQFTNIPYYLTYNNWINNSFVVPPVAVFESPVGGTGPFPGSGSLDMIPNNGTENTSILLAGNYDFSLPGKTLYAATMFKVKNPTANTRATQFGFVTATNVGINDTAPQGFSTVIVQSTAQPAPTYELRHQRRTTGGGLMESTLTGTASLTLSNWYKLSISYTNTRSAGNSNYAVAAVLQDMGPLGTTPGATVLSFVTETNNADIVNFKNVYLALRSFENGGMENRDNTYVWTTPGNIFFVQEPQNQTVTQGVRAQFKALVDGEGPYSYQWSSNGVPIPGARSWNYITPPVTTADSGSTYTVEVTGPANMITSSPATLMVTPQTLAVVSAGSVDGSTVGVKFNQPVDPVTAANPANYTINGMAAAAARVHRTSLGAQGPDGIYVVLTPASILSGSFTVVVSGVQDLSGGGVGGANSAAGSVANLTGFDVNPAITGPAGENYSFGPGQFIVTGGGVDLFSGFDSFRYVYTTRTGDFDLVYQIPYMDSVRFTAKGGVDARMLLEPGSPGVFAGFDPGPIGEGTSAPRQYTEGTAKAIWGGGGISWGANTRLFHPNVWMRFRRAGNSFLRYSSTNGVNWQCDGQFSQSLLTPFPETMYVGLAVCSARNLQPESVQFENFGEFTGYPGATIAISAQPMNATNAAGSAATITNLTATVTGGGIPGQGEMVAIWQRFDGVDWTNMPTAGATNRNLSVGTVWGTDNGAQYRAILMAPGALSVTSAVATLTVTDTALPTISSAGVGGIGVLPFQPVSEIIITFSEPVSAATATALGNYTVTNAAGVPLTVLSATFLPNDPRTILLKVSGPLDTGTASVRVSGVRDLNNNLLATAVRTFRSFLPPTGPVVVEVYQDVGNTIPVTGLTGNALFTGQTPSYMVYSNLFGFNVVSGFASSQDNYGVKAYSYFVPPTNGNYKFWIRSDDAMELWMNTNGIAADPIPTSVNSPAGQTALQAVDNNTATKYLNFDKINAGFTVTPNTPSIVTGLRFTTGGDAPERDPLTFRLEGTIGTPQNGPWTLVATGNTGFGTDPGRTVTVPPVTFANATAYSSYRITFPTIRNFATANSMQISEVEFLDAGSLDVTRYPNQVLIVSNTAANGNYSVGTTPSTSITNITLVGGQRYYMEARLKEATGGDGFSVMWTAPTVNTAPTVTTLIPNANLAYPASAAPPTPVVMELYTGYQNFLPGFANLSGLYAATNFPQNNYSLDVVNFKYIAGLPDVIGHQPYFGVQPKTLGNTRLDNYLGRAISYFIPPTNGLYRFYVAVDDVAQLWMNTNAMNSTDPAGKKLLGTTANAFVSTAGQLLAQNVPLVGGQRYYTEVLWKEGTGGDGIRLAMRSQGDTAVPPTTEIIPFGMLEYPTALGRAGAVDFTHIASSAPQSVDGTTTTVKDGDALVLLPAGIRGAPPYGGYTWTKNGVRILENTFTNYTLPVTMADHGAVYTVTVTNFFSSATRSLTVNVTADGTAPTVTRTIGWRDGDGFTLQFSEPLDALTATHLANYQVNNGLVILGATLDVSQTMLSMRTTPQTAGTLYTVTINGVKDRSSTGNTIAANTTATFSAWTFGGQGILVELFTNIQGGAVADLTGTTKFQANLPDVIYYTNVFGAGLFAGNSQLENYGARISGYFVPTNTGLYRFYARSDDASQLWMNINSADSLNPAGRTMLIHIPSANLNINSPNAISAPVPLNAGQPYYMEALLKEGGGGDYFQMTFRPTDADGTAIGTLPVDNTVLENTSFAFFGGISADTNGIQILSPPPATLTVVESNLVTLTLVADIPQNMRGATSYRWQRMPFGAGVFTDVPGGTNASLIFGAALSDDQSTYRVILTAPAFSASFDTLLTVLPDVTAPYLVSVGSVDGNSIGICFNELVETNTAGDNFSYTVNGGIINVISVETRPDGRSFRLVLDAPVTTPYTVEAYGIPDLATTPNVGDSSATGRLENFTPLDIGAPPGPGNSYSCNTNEIDVIAGGADIWGASDQGHMTLRPITGNFDVWARLNRLTRAAGDADGITKAGIMVRETFDANARKVQYLAEPPVSIGGRDIYEAGQRPTLGAATAAWAGGNGNVGGPAGVPNTWIRVKRSGNVFSAFRSADGVNWTQTTMQTLALPGTVLVGLATTAHIPSPSAATVLAEYRNIHIPLPPTILVQPSPAIQSVPLHSAFSYSVTVSNAPDAGPLTLQWFRNGLPIAGATTDTYSVADAMVADGGIYTVQAGNDGGVVTSQEAALTVLNGLPVVVNDMLMATQGMAHVFPAASLVANDTDPEGDGLSVFAVSGIVPGNFTSDFNSGNPPGAVLFPSGNVAATGGVGDSGVLKLTDSVASQAGSFILDELTPLRRVTAFTASFLLRIGDGSAEPADGFSFNFAGDLPLSAGTPAAAEQGGGTGFSFCVDNYRFAPLNVGGPAGTPGGGTANTSGLKVNFGNVILAGVQLPGAWNSPRFVPVSITVMPGGELTVLVDGTNVFGALTLPGWSPRTGRFGMYARTGGQTAAHWVDNLSVTVNTLETGRPLLTGAAAYGSSYITNQSGVGNSGALHLTDAVNGQAGSMIIDDLLPGRATKSFTASFALQIGSGSADGADGFSFNLASDLPNSSTGSTVAEEGIGTGLSLSVDNYPGVGALDSPSLKLKYGGTLLGLVIIPKWNSPNYIPVSITLNPAGELTVVVDGTNVVAGLPLPFTPMSGARFGFFSRTGGLNQRHWLDNVAITSTADDGTVAGYSANFDNLTPGTVTLSGGQITYTPPSGLCGPDSFYYIVNDGQVGGFTTGRVDVVIKEAVPAAPVITHCPPSRNLPVSPACTAVVPDLRGELLATDNCCCFTITQSPLPGLPLNFGAHVITLTVTDTEGLSATCMATVTVLDATAPEITCSPNLVVECTGPLGAMVSFATPASDNCDPAPIVLCSPASGSQFPLGVTIVNCEASDASFNTNTCSFTVTVQDTSGPVMTCPAPVVLYLAEGLCSTNASYGTPTLSDCDPGAGFFCEPASGSVFPAGTNTVTCFGYDTHGNTNQCSFTVAVLELVKPSIVCPPDLIVDCGDSTVPPATGTATATDNCDTNVVVTFVDGLALESLAGHTNHWVFSVSGDPLTASAGITAGPSTPPLGTGSLRLAIGSDGDNVAQARNTNYHNVPLSAVSELAFRTYRTAGGVNQSIYLILNIDLDGDGLLDDLLFFEPQYQDGDNPMLPNQGTLAAGTWQSWNAMVGGWHSLNHAGLMSAGPGVKTLATYIAAFPTAKVVNTSAGAGGIRLVAGLGLGGWANFDGSVDQVAIGVNGISKVHDFDDAAGIAPLLQQIVRTWTAVDDSGNVISCSQVIKVRDITPPVLTCSPNLVVECNAPGGATVSYITTANDACDGVITPVCEPASGSYFAMGLSTVNCHAVDLQGNSNSCSFTITVQDTTPPVIVCPANLIAECVGGLGTPVSYVTTATDVCDTNLLVVCTPAPGSLFPLGTTTVSCSVGDVSGNSNSCSFTVTVQDTTVPVIVCSPNLVVECTSPAGAVATYVTTASDVCDAVPALVCAPVSGSTFPPGLTTVHCLATDASGNSNACSFTISVVDTTPPVIACSTNITVEAISPAGAPVTYVVTTSDLCDTNPVLVCSPVSGSTFALGLTTVNCLSTDASSNSNACSFTVTVQDTTVPNITCPANIVVECGTPAGTLVNFTVTATDIADPSPVITSTPPSGSVFPPGVTTVTNVARDASGNSNVCTFTVTVIDTTPPVRCANPPVIVMGGVNDGFLGVEPAGPSANLQARLSSVDLRNFDEAVADGWLGHSFGALPNYIAEAKLRIKLRADVGVPENDTVQLLFTGPGGSAQPQEWTRRIGSGFDATPGVLPITWSLGSETELVLDLGRLTNANASVTDLLPQLRTLRYLDVIVQDDTLVDYMTLELTVCQCQPDLVVSKDPMGCGATVAFPTPPFADNCDPHPMVVCVPSSGSFFPVGATLVTCTATDMSGNSAVCTFNVTVMDASATLTIVQSGANVIISWPTPCGPAVLEETGDLTAPISWSPVGAPVVNVGPLSEVTVPATGLQRYFRLRQ